MLYPFMRVTIAVVATCVLLILFQNFSGFFVKPQDDPQWVMAASASTAGTGANAAGGGAPAGGAGAKVFGQICAACHQSSGKGMPGIYPPLAGSEIAQGDPTGPARIVLHGFTGKINRAGKDINGTMPAFGGQLSDDDIAAVLTYVRSSWGNSAPAVDAATVKEVRDKTASHTAAMTEPEVKQAL